MKRIYGAIAGLAVLATPVAAQQGGHQPGMPGQGQAMMVHCQMMQGGMDMMGGGMGMMGGGRVPGMGAEGAGNMPMRNTMVQAMRLWPQYLIQQKDSLGLTSEQVTKLEGLEGQENMPMGRMDDMRAAQDELAKAFENGNEAGIRAAADRMSKVHADMQVAHLVFAANVRAVLTPDQRTRLEQLPGPCRMGAGQGMMRHEMDEAAAPHGEGHEAHHR